MIVPTDHVAGKESVHNSPRRSGCLNFQRLTTLFTSYLAFFGRTGAGADIRCTVLPKPLSSQILFLREKGEAGLYDPFNQILQQSHCWMRATIQQHTQENSKGGCLWCSGSRRSEHHNPGRVYGYTTG